MPKMITIVADPKHANYKGLPPKKKRMTLPYVSAMQNIAQSGGLYSAQPEAAPVVPGTPSIRPLEDHSNEELKQMAVALGATLTGKKIPRVKLIEMIRNRLSGVEVVDEEPTE